MSEFVIDGVAVSVRTEELEKYKTLRMVRDAGKDPLAVFELLDGLVEGGADRLAEILDPEGQNPGMDAFGEFVEKIFAALAKDIGAKNS